ncbi:uncharacterized protein PRCAT00001108001 [Priceomyces carsonii]|uniref:uncharacterized protein n=1 Tax=Priceomyces carsonii TaxID=28549 RepID=UPI002ED88A24|nr:unnamed protein product [Priceomyces carsonii]
MFLITGKALGSKSIRLITTWLTNPQKCNKCSRLQLYKFFSSKSILRIDNRQRPWEPITKRALLEKANNPISRLWVHLKWPLMRDNRPLSLDDISAFVSWLVMGNLLWVGLGTTTFGLVAMYSLYTYDNIKDAFKSYFKNLSSEGTKPKIEDGILGKMTNSILSHGLGINIEFKKGNALPSLKEGLLTFNNLCISSVESADTSFNFSAHIESMRLSLSFSKWYDGKGLISKLEINGMNVKMIKSSKVESITTDYHDVLPLPYGRHNDNIHFQYDMEDHHREELELMEVKRTKQNKFINPDYEFGNIKILDSYLEVQDDVHKYPLKISIFNCELPKLRGGYLLGDVLNASNVTGAINDSMFTIHKRQNVSNIDMDRNKRIRFKLDGINMASINGPHLRFNWIIDGKAEITADITLPDFGVFEESDYRLKDEYKRLTKVCSNLFNEFFKMTSSEQNKNADNQIPDKSNSLLKSALAAIYETFTNPSKGLDFDIHKPLQEYAIVDVKVRLSNLKALLPKELPTAQSSGIPYVSLYNLRALIAFINDYRMHNKQPITIKTTVIEKLFDLHKFDNVVQTKMFDSIVSDIYDELQKMAKMDEERILNTKSSMWSHSIASQILLLGLGAIA